MGSLASHTGHELWVGLLCLSQSTGRAACRQEVKKLWLKHQFPIRHNPGVLAVELREWRGIFTLPLCNGLAAAALEEWQTQVVLYVKSDSPPHLGHVSTRDGATTAQTEGLPDPQTAKKDLGCTAASDSQFLKWELQMRQGMSKVGGRKKEQAEKKQREDMKKQSEESLRKRFKGREAITLFPTWHY